ncbi:MAG: outer membrane beta-barrel family protein, partial [Candidatus Marinimicrobia bacterium]|nr:outer membrane beta-barrel family protein [Candidatus Neomarinimicrobiota bacterium]MDP6593731.1 outer membrane beta-barrel family protein [Candidatus Neomarinimicrobiota bacterium]
VEVMTNPGAKYDPEGMAGIINIVLKENKFAGLNGNFNSSADSRGGKNVSGQINWRTLAFNTYANVGVRRRVRQFSGDSYRTMQFRAYENILDQSSEGDGSGDNLFLKTGFEYFIDPTQSVGISATLNGGNGRNDDLTTTVEYEVLESQYFRTSDGLNDHGGYDLNLNYDRKFKNPKQKLTSFARYSSGGSDGSTEYWTTPQAGFEDVVSQDRAKNGNEGKDSNFELKADYVHPFENGNVLEVGMNSRIRTRDDSQLAFLFDEASDLFIDDSLYSNRFLYDENIHAAYVQYSTTIGMFGITAGGRYENVAMKSQLVNTDETFENPYSSFYPSLSVSAGAPQIIQVQASYSRRVNRPRSRQLNPFKTRQDLYNVRTGNPFLKPEYVDSYEINIGRFSRGLSLNFGPYYRHMTDKIQRHKVVTEDGISIATYANISEQISKGVEYSIVGSLGQKFRLMFSGSVYWDEINTDIFGEDYNSSVKGQRYVINTTWNMSPTTELMFFMFYRPAQEIPIGKMGSMSWSAVSLKKKFLNERLNLSVRMGDPFNLSGLHFETWGENWYQEANRDFFSQTVTLSLEYRFGKMEDRSRFSRPRGGAEDGNRDDFEIY